MKNVGIVLLFHANDSNARNISSPYIILNQGIVDNRIVKFRKLFHPKTIDLSDTTKDQIKK